MNVKQKVSTRISEIRIGVNSIERIQ